MLRLQPSELNLTPNDVDETFRRIALRQTSRAEQHWTMPPATQPGRPNRPILRRGPQRLIRHAMTINNIPIQQPQQAVMTMVDEDDHDHDESHQQVAQPPVRDNNRPILAHSSHQRNGATVGSPMTVPSHSMRLPLRLRPHVQMLDAQTVSHEQAEGSTSLTPRDHHPRPERPASTRNVENGNEQRAQLPSVDPSPNTPGLRGGGLACVARPHNLTHDTIYTSSPLNHIQQLSSRSGGGQASLACASGVAQDTIHAPSPLDQTQRLTSSTQQASPGDVTKPHNSPSTGYPTPNLNKRCTAETLPSTHCPGRTHMPSATTEARSRHGRGSSHAYSEVGDASNARHFSSTLQRLGQSDQTSLRRRERGSGDTNASTAYSWYGSLGSDTHFPGSENSQDDESCPQLDGARDGAHRLSPLPSLPYTRMQSDYTASSPPSAHSRQLSRDHVAAVTAVGYGFQSPLGAHVEPYQRRQYTPCTLLNFPTYANPTTSSVGGLPIDRTNRDQDIPSGNAVRLGPDPDDGASRQQSSPEHRTYSLRSISRTGEYPRLEQRSSENDPVSVPVHQSDVARHGRVQMQRAIYERLQNPAHPTHAGTARDVEMISSHDSAPRRNPPHDVSHQSHNGMALDGERFDSGSSMDMHRPRQPFQGQTQDAVHAGPWRPLPSQFSRQHSAESTRQASPHVYDGGSGGGRVRPRRDGPLSTLASLEPGSSDTWRRRWQSPPIRSGPAATTRRHQRVRGEQVDQENAGEEELMRREEANVTARYGEEEQQRTTMNETPPRIGRVERRMME